MELFSLVNTATNKIEVGPRPWKIAFFKKFLDSKDVVFDDYPRNPITEKLVIPNSNYVILPTTISDPPAMDSFFQQPAGPYYTIGSNSVTGAYTIGTKYIDQIAYKMKQEATAKRYDKEISGVEVGGMNIATDRQSQSLIVGTRLKSDQDNTKTFNWKGTNGWTTLDRATIVFVSDAVFDYVESCFDIEMGVHNSVDTAVTNNPIYADTVTALKAIDIEAAFE